MAHQEFGTGKSLVVLAIVVGCFAVLWPKIFYPMMQTAFAMTSPKLDTDNFRETDRPPHLHPGSINPRVRNSLPSDIEDKFNMREGRPFPHPQARQPVKAQPKSGGAMSIIMPIYTVGIIVFFLYTVLKLVFKKPEEGEKKPLIKDFHMDPQYSKFMCDSSCEIKKSSKKQDLPVKETINTPEIEAEDTDSKDYEIYKLKKKLEETEEAMNRIMKHMGAMSACLSGMDKTYPEKENTDIRLRHKGSSKGKNKRFQTEEYISDEKRKMLQENFAKAMFSIAQLSTKPCVENLLEKSAPQKQDEHQSDNHSDDDDNDEISADQTESSGDEIIVDEQYKDNYYTNGCCCNSQESCQKAL